MDTRRFGISAGWTWYHILVDWIWIVSAIILSVSLPGWPAYLIAFAIIGSRQHAIAVHLHDASHYLLFNSRRCNDRVARVLMEWPLFASLDGYRELHRGHHRYLNTQLDPDWARNQPERLGTARGFSRRLMLLSGFAVFYQALSVMFLGQSVSGEKKVAVRYSSFKWLTLRWIFYATLALIFIYNGVVTFFFWFWMVPYFFYFFPVMRYRGISEHWAVPSESMLNKARTVLVGPVEAFLFYPKNINFHVEHHNYPTVPFYHLSALHRELIANEAYRNEVHLSYGVFGVLKEFFLFRGKKCHIHKKLRAETD